MVTVVLSIVGTGVTTYFLLRYDATPWIYIPGLISTVFFIVILVLCGIFARRKNRTVIEFFWPPGDVENSSVQNLSEKVKLIVRHG